MLVNTAQSVSHALEQGLHWLRIGGLRQPSRVGDVIVAPAPVLTIYERPMNRVLFSAMRDANPFFHVMEALWMLAGRRDLEWLGYFNKKMLSFSDDGGITQPGAYGWRWRNYFGYDQLETIITDLKMNPHSRRNVLAMWDGGQRRSYYDYKPESDLAAAFAESKDVPCNTHAYFDTIGGNLNMTVCCRSNDIIWGAHGANAVHFSFLLEYVSAMAMIPMGVYRQFSNNYHLYTNIVPEEQMMPLAREVEATDKYRERETKPGNRIVMARVPLRQVDLVDHPDSFLNDLEAFMLWSPGEITGFHNTFFEQVAVPMREAWAKYKERRYDDAIVAAERIRAEDWRLACIEWLQRRKIKAQVNEARFVDVVPTNQDAEEITAFHQQGGENRADS